MHPIPTFESLKNSSRNRLLINARIDSDLDDIMRCDAFDMRINKNELYVRYLMLGIEKSTLLGWDDNRVISEIQDLDKAQTQVLGHKMGRVLRMMTLQPELYDPLRAMALETKTSKEDILSFYMRLGIQYATERNERRAPQKPPRVFRQICFDTEDDELLNQKAKDNGKDVEDLYRYYLKLGLQAEQEKNQKN
jgi:hypothetical protein